MDEPRVANRARPVTMRDVAAAAGVSTALVSIVLRGAPGASDETRERVLGVAAEIGYRTNRSAQLMKLSRTRLLGVTFDVRSAFHGELLEHIQAAALAADYEIAASLVSAQHSESRAIETLLGFRCEALLLLGSQLSQPRLRKLAEEIPLVVLGRQVRGDDIHVVRSGDRRGQVLVVDHLVGLGHRRIAHVDGGAGPISTERRAGYRAAMKRHGLDDDVVPGGTSEADGRAAAAALLGRDLLPTAICAFNDRCALGLMDALGRAGVQVPGEVSITGYDDSVIAELAAVDLTSVSQDPAGQASAAIRTAVARLEGSGPASLDEVLSPRLVVRGSAAAPRTT